MFEPTVELLGLSRSHRSFECDELTLIWRYIASFFCFEHYRRTRCGDSEVFYWHETCSDLTRLNRNSRLMTENMGVESCLGIVKNGIEIDQATNPVTR